METFMYVLSAVAIVVAAIIMIGIVAQPTGRTHLRPIMDAVFVECERLPATIVPTKTIRLDYTPVLMAPTANRPLLPASSAIVLVGRPASAKAPTATPAQAAGAFARHSDPLPMTTRSWVS